MAVAVSYIGAGAPATGRTPPLLPLRPCFTQVRTGSPARILPEPRLPSRPCACATLYSGCRGRTLSRPSSKFRSEPACPTHWRCSAGFRVLDDPSTSRDIQGEDPTSENQEELCGKNGVPLIDFGESLRKAKLRISFGGRNNHGIYGFNKKSGCHTRI
jgi:hypothetical protein